MHDYVFKDWFFFILSIFLAMMLLVLPLPIYFQWLRPNWVLLVLLFWVLNAPMLMGPGWYWLIGLFQDLLQATPFGLHALSYALLAFFLTRLSFRLSAFPMWQQLLVLIVVSVLNSAITALVSVLFGVTINFALVLLPALTNCLIWPWLYWLMYSLWKRRLRVY